MPVQTKSYPEQLQQLLSRQFIITAYVGHRIEVVNYTLHGYHGNWPVLANNSFLLAAAYEMYRGMIIDLFALFGKASTTNRNSFHFINHRYKELLNPGSIEQIKGWLKNKEASVQALTKVRHTSSAHYSFEKGSAISQNFDHLTDINDLFDLARRIITYCGNRWINEEQKTGYDFGMGDNLQQSLENLVKQAAGLDSDVDLTSKQ